MTHPLIKDSYLSCDIVIFCGGRGTRLSQITHEMPKPLIELGDYPILWHIMKIYSHYNYDRFILTLGYKGEMISTYFLYQYPLTKTFSIHLSNPEHPVASENWDISFVQTGLESKTSRRLYLCKNHIETNPFMVTYGDGVADIDIHKLMNRHQELQKKYGIVATITLTRPHSKYGIAKLNGDIIESFNEKPLIDDYINVGFMVLDHKIFDYIQPDIDCMFEETLKQVASEGKLGYYIHEGFWHAMDNYKDYEDLNRMWREEPKWKIWSD